MSKEGSPTKMFPRWFYWAAAGLMMGMQLTNCALARAQPMVHNNKTHAEVLYVLGLICNTGILVHLSILASGENADELSSKVVHFVWASCLSFVWFSVLSYHLLYDFYRSDLTLPLGCWHIVPLYAVAAVLVYRWIKKK